MITDEQIMQIFEKTDRPDLNDFTVRFARAIIEAHEQSKWIKFDRNDNSTYPPHELRVLVLTKRGEVDIDFFIGSIEDFFYYDFENITSWQPLPELPNKIGRITMTEDEQFKDLEKRIKLARDRNVASVADKMLERSDIGFKKYGTTTERNDIDLQGWLTHLQEELMDASIYIERIKNELRQK